MWKSCPFNFEYNFSVDNDLSSTNYNLIKTDLKINKFVTTFEFLQEDDEVGNENHYSNEMKFLFNIIAILTISTHSKLANSQGLILSTKETLNQSKEIYMDINHYLNF